MRVQVLIESFAGEVEIVSFPTTLAAAAFVEDCKTSRADVCRRFTICQGGVPVLTVLQLGGRWIEDAPGGGRKA